MTIRLFELVESLEVGRSAKAVMLLWNGTEYARSNEALTVFDFVGTHGLPGDRGYALYSPESQHWEVLGGLMPQEYPTIV